MNDLQKQGKLDYDWGYEIIWSNGLEFSGKLVVFEKANMKTPMTMSKLRKKAWFVNAGKFKLTFIDISNGETKEAILSEGQTVEMGELSPHSLESLEPNSVIFEVGSSIKTDDTCYLTPNQTQTEDSQQESI